MCQESMAHDVFPNPAAVLLAQQFDTSDHTKIGLSTMHSFTCRAPPLYCESMVHSVSLVIHTAGRRPRKYNSDVLLPSGRSSGFSLAAGTSCRTTKHSPELRLELQSALDGQAPQKVPLFRPVAQRRMLSSLCNVLALCTACNMSSSCTV